jgi:VanZ like family
MNPILDKAPVKTLRGRHPIDGHKTHQPSPKPHQQKYFRAQKVMMINTNRKWLICLSLITIVWMGLIYVESSQLPPKILGEVPGLDKVAHFAAYSILGVMMLAILTLIDSYKKIPVVLLTVFLVVLAGVFDEFHQAFVPGRNANGWDLLADFCGGLFATFVISPFVKKREINHA